MSSFLRDANKDGSISFKRKFGVEFQSNLTALTQKTSWGKKTCRALNDFFKEKANIEQAYATRLMALARSGGSTSIFSSSLSIIDHKKKEEETVQAALNSLIDFTIQESEFHKAYSEELRSQIMTPLQNIRLKLSKEKKIWKQAIDALNKNMAQVREKLQQDQAKLKAINSEISTLNMKKDKIKKGLGLSPSEELAKENMPAELQRLQCQIEEKQKRKQIIANSSEASNTTASQAQEKYVHQMKAILSIIEENETNRILIIRKALENWMLHFQKKMQSETALSDIVMKTFQNISSESDIQKFIEKNSLCSVSEEELKELYISMGEDIANETPKPKGTKEIFESEQDLLFQEKLKKEMHSLKLIRSRVGALPLSLYPQVPTLKDLNLCPELRFEPLNYVLYAFLLYASSAKAEEALPASPFRNTIREAVDSNLNMKEISGACHKAVHKAWGLGEPIQELISDIINGFCMSSKPQIFSLRTNGLHSFLTLCLQNLQESLLFSKEISEIEANLYKGVYTLVYAYLFNQILAKAQYKEEEFESECNGLIQLFVLNSYMSEVSILENKDFLEYTLKMLYELSKAKYSLRAPLSFSLTIFHNYIWNLLVEEQGETSILRENLEELMEELQPLMLALSIPIEFQYLYLLQSLLTRYILPADFRIRDATVHSALKTAFSLVEYVKANHSAAVFDLTKIKSTDFYLSTVNTPLGLQSNLNCNDRALVIEKTERFGIFMKCLEHFEVLISDYPQYFNLNRNKLLIILNIYQTLYLASHGLLEELPFSQKMNLLLECNGQKCIEKIIEACPRPFTIGDSLLNAVSMFSDQISHHKKYYHIIVNKQ